MRTEGVPSHKAVRRSGRMFVEETNLQFARWTLCIADGWYQPSIGSLVRVKSLRSWITDQPITSLAVPAIAGSAWVLRLL